MSFDFSSENDSSQIPQYMKLTGESPYIFVHHQDIIFAAYIINDTSFSISQMEVWIHPGVQTDLPFMDEVPNISLLTIFGLVYEAKLDSRIDEDQHNLEGLRNAYRVFLNHLSRNMFSSLEHQDRWGDYIDPFLFELADAILRKTSVFSSLIYNLGFKVEWKEKKIANLTWFPLHLSS